MMMLEDFGFISRDIYAFYPLLIRFIDRNKTQWITNRDPSAEELFWKCADIFLHWAQSIVSIKRRKMTDNLKGGLIRVLTRSKKQPTISTGRLTT